MHKTMEDENMNQTSLTGVPSADRPWMQYYPEMLRRMIHLPDCTVKDYLRRFCPGDNVDAIFTAAVSLGRLFSRRQRIPPVRCGRWALAKMTRSRFFCPPRRNLFICFWQPNRSALR